MGLFGSMKLPGGQNDRRSIEEKLKVYISQDESHYIEEIKNLISELLKKRLNIDIKNSQIGEEVKIANFVKLAKSSEVIKHGILASENYIVSIKELFNLSASQLKYVCLKCGLFYGIDNMNKSKKNELVYIPMSKQYLKSLNTNSFDKALNMIACIYENDPKAEIDKYLKERGKKGFSAIPDLIESAARKGIIRIGPVEKFICTIYNGLWIINEKYSKDQNEMNKSLAWLACKELGVPPDLKENLLIQIETENCLGEISFKL